MTKCDIASCANPASVRVLLERPATTATRNKDFTCWTGRLEMRYCAKHGSECVTRSGDWEFFGDTITLSPLSESRVSSSGFTRPADV